MNFKSIIGYRAIKLELSRILDQLTNPDKYSALGVTEPHGLLLHGVPGVGKSTFANAVVEESGRTVFVCRKDKSNGDFVNEIVHIFDKAAESAPSIVLLDDLDKFANEDERRRDSEEFVTVQACIDKVKDKSVFVVATANNIQKLPDSLIRAGRFDHVLELRCPSGKDAEEIIAFYLSKKPFVADINVRLITRLLEGRSCAELESVINQAGTYAAFDGRDKVEMKDMIKAILRIIFKAPESFDEDISALPLVACHEAGHAVQYATNYAPIKLRAAIIPITNFGSKLAMPLILLGVVLSFLGNFSYALVYLGIACFGLSLVFQLVTLPVEFNASRRAVRAISEAGILTSQELSGAKKTLKAAAMTYVAATAVSLAQLLRLIILFGGRRRRD
jgi:Zn-dependent membrane protease YugP